MSETSKIGRPLLPKKEKRGQYVTTRVSPAEYDEIEKAANESGDMMATWARKKLLAAARRA
jgi:peptidyl-tRNA hydrolase